MAEHSKISWTDSTWNPVRGCTVVSPGCTNCYAMGVAARFSGPGKPYEGLAERRNGHAVWTGKVVLIEKHLEDPLRWQKPRRVFVNSMSDLFHESIPDEWLDRICDVMKQSPKHIFQVLTKRPERMRRYLRERWLCRACGGDGNIAYIGSCPNCHGNCYDPPSNVWLGVSVEDQRRADERIPILIDTPAAVRFLSCEPLLGPVRIRRYLSQGSPPPGGQWAGPDRLIDWCIVGGESGPRHRPMNLEWAEQLRVDCREAGTAFWFKQVSGPHSGMGEDALGRVYQEFPEAVL